MLSGVNMRINRNMLLKLANDAIDRITSRDLSVMAAYMQGSMLGDTPLIGNTADIDLFFIHRNEVQVEREIVRISDEVHLDISHHSHMLYRQPRELRIHPWLGPAIYGCKIMYDPQHFLDFVQASVRGQFNSAQNVLSRVRQQVEHAREMWEELDKITRLPEPTDIAFYLRALEHVAQGVAGLSGPNLTERRFLLDLPGKAEAVGKPGLYAGYLGLLGGTAMDGGTIQAWLNDWQQAYMSLPPASAPIRLHPARFSYYWNAFNTMLAGCTVQATLWPLWHTWTDIICKLPPQAAQVTAWEKVGDQLGLSGASFRDKVAGLDAYLDQVEELLEDWARENGG